MARPWYTYPLLFAGCIALLAAAFRPMVGATSTAPGALLIGPERRLYVRPGSPLARAGLETGDLFLRGETVETAPGGRVEPPRLRWTRGIPRSGWVEFSRGGVRRSVRVYPARPAWPVRLAWWVTGMLNVGLTALALALFWQRPRDGTALLLGLVLMLAPVFAFPGEPRLLSLALAAHFFTVFPPPPSAPARRPWRAGLLYLPLALLGLLGTALRDGGETALAGALFDATAVGYALYGAGRTLARWRGAQGEARPVARTLLVAAGAILAAVLLGISQRFWVFSGQFVPANLLPAALFSAATAHLVFRLRAVEVRVTARRTLQYLLARWTLGTLFLIPGFFLVWRLGQLSVTPRDGGPGEVVPYLIWMFATALLLGKRQSVLRNLDRRFFRDVEARRQALIRLAGELGEQTESPAVLEVLSRSAGRIMEPSWARCAPPDEPAPPDTALSIPLRCGRTIYARLLLGPRASGEPYAAEERELLEAAAVQAALSLENARLGAALLARQRAALAVRTAGVLAGAEEERRRLAADLHDQVLPELRQIAGEVDRLRQAANGLAPELERLAGDLRTTMDSVREVMETLRPSALDMLGLADALESYFRRGAARQGGIPSVSARRVGEEPAMAPERSLALYRICQEAINNVLQHSGATRAGLEVRNTGESLALVIWDNGRGLDADAAGGSGRGLGNIRYRADLVGAAVRWLPEAGGGTRVEVTLPLATGEREEAGCAR